MLDADQTRNWKTEMTQDESTVQSSSWDQIVDGKQSSGELLSQEEKLKVFWLFVLARNDYCTLQVRIFLRIWISNSYITVMIIIKVLASLYYCWFWYFMWFTSQLFEILKQARDHLFITSIQAQNLLPQSESSQIKVAEIPWQSKSFIAAGNDSLIHRIAW